MTHPTKPCPRCGRECMFRGEQLANHTCVDGRAHAGGELQGEPSKETYRAALHEALDGWTSWRTYYLNKMRAERGVDFTFASEVQDEAETLTRLRAIAGPRPTKQTERCPACGETFARVTIGEVVRPAADHEPGEWRCSGCAGPRPGKET